MFFGATKNAFDDMIRYATPEVEQLRTNKISHHFSYQLSFICFTMQSHDQQPPTKTRYLVSTPEYKQTHFPYPFKNPLLFEDNLS